MRETEGERKRGNERERGSEMALKCATEEDAAALADTLRWSSTLHPTLYTLHPTPYALLPPPYTQHPTPCSLHPTPNTLHPAPHTLAPTPYTLLPLPYTLHPTPSETQNRNIRASLPPALRPSGTKTNGSNAEGDPGSASHKFTPPQVLQANFIGVVQIHQ